MIVKTSNNRQTQRLPLASKQQLVYKHPLAFWGGLWVSLLLVGAMAARGLMSPGSIAQKQPEPISVGSVEQEQPEPISSGNVEQEQPEPTPASRIIQESPNTRTTFTSVPEAQQDNSVPLWLYGAIALICAFGFVLICLSFSYRPQPRKPLKRQVRKTAPTATSRHPVRKKRQRPQQLRRLVQPKARRQPQVPTEPAFVAAPVVTVLPPEDRHPLDLGDQSLADMMDLRKRQSLPSLLGDRQ